MNRFKTYIREQMKYVDRTYWVLFFLLIIVAIIALFSASSALAFKEGNSVLTPIGSQFAFILIGLALAFIIQFFPSRIITALFGYILLKVWGIKKGIY